MKRKLVRSFGANAADGALDDCVYDLDILADKVAGVHVAFAIAAALFDRQRGGKGQIPGASGRNGRAGDTGGAV